MNEVAPRKKKQTCLKSLYCRRRINQTRRSSETATHSHIPRPFSSGEEVRPEDTTALTNGHIERGARCALCFGT